MEAKRSPSWTFKAPCKMLSACCVVRSWTSADLTVALSPTSTPNTMFSSRRLEATTRHSCEWHRKVLMVKHLCWKKGNFWEWCQPASVLTTKNCTMNQLTSKFNEWIKLYCAFLTWKRQDKTYVHQPPSPQLLYTYAQNVLMTLTLAMN